MCREGSLKGGSHGRAVDEETGGVGARSAYCALQAPQGKGNQCQGK